MGNFGARGLLHWHAPAIRWLHSRCNGTYEQTVCSSRDLYTFGVYTGRTMRGIAIAMNSTRVPFRRFWGFDSFQGLPEESLGTVRSPISRREWQRGSWNVADVLHDYNAASVQQKLIAYIGEPRAQFVVGFYNESLTSTLPVDRGMRPALFVEFDCDLYISTLQALNFMLAHKLIVKGTLIGYDDYGLGGAGGQARAHREVLQKYRLKVSPVFDRVLRKIFVVDAVG